MHAPLALLLPLVALAHAAGPRDRDITIYERGSTTGMPKNHKHFYMPKGQCTAVIEKENLLCKVTADGAAEWVPPLRLRVATSADLQAPHIRITDRHDRVELRRQPPCRHRLEVHLHTECLKLK